jgi:hypothetical protein
LEFETTAVGNQSLLVSGLNFKLKPTQNKFNGVLNYQFEKLFLESFSGNRHSLNGYFNLKTGVFKTRKLFKSDGALTSNFIRNQSQIRFHLIKLDWY